MKDGPVRWMREFLAGWLEREDLSPEHLMDWLQGYGLPGVGTHEEPFMWLLRGLPIGPENQKARTKLAGVAAKLLERRPDETLPGDSPEQLLYNLYYLCAGLRRAEELSELLYDVYTRRSLQGTWGGQDLRAALLAGLISSQLDSRLKPVWQEMAEGTHDFLPGDQDDAIEGVRLMRPPSSDGAPPMLYAIGDAIEPVRLMRPPLSERGAPALDAIGDALKTVASRRDDLRSRARFRSALHRIKDTYPGRRWGLSFLLQAQRTNWPVWAFEGIPDLPSAVHHALRRCPDSSPRARRGVINEEIIALVNQLEGDDPMIRDLWEAHRQSLKTLAVGARE